MKRVRKPKPQKGRVPMPPPTIVMRDRRARRLREKLREELKRIDKALSDKEDI